MAVHARDQRISRTALRVTHFRCEVNLLRQKTRQRDYKTDEKRRIDANGTRMELAKRQAYCSCARRLEEFLFLRSPPATYGYSRLRHGARLR
jgi:hypothetical protein